MIARTRAPVGRSFYVFVAALALALGVFVARRGQAEQAEEWSGNRVGQDEIVLPGFDPIRTEGTTVRPGGRSYVWEKSFLPIRVDSLGKHLTGPIRLVARTGSVSRDLLATDVRLVETSDHHAIVRASGEPIPGLRLRTETRVEYDGVAMVELVIEPDTAVELDGLDLVVDVDANRYTQMQSFAATEIRGRHRRPRVEPPYRGDFLNAVGLADGERSFWWFADDAKGWIWNGDTVTEVEPRGDVVRIRQRLIGAAHRLSEPMNLAFNFLATPVRSLGSEWRADRIVATANRQWKGLGKLHLWWTTAFAHVDLPFTTFPPGVEARIPKSDRSGYPGLAENRKNLAEWRRELGIERIPYFSAHVLSELDPTLARHRSEWEIDPPLVMKSGVSRLGTKFEKPFLSHRSRAYQDYVVFRLDRELGRLGASGIYFDQGGVIDTRNRAHGGWLDSRGRLQPSLDILGLRQFLKRVRVALHNRGQPGYVFIHNSLVEIIPAYTFAWGMVGGERFRHQLKNDDYIGSISVDQTRVRFAPSQYGVLNVWIPQFFYFHKGEASWNGSPGQRLATRNFLALSLIHDVPILPTGLDLDVWRAWVRQSDDFGVDAARFVGYWNEDLGVAYDPADVRVSRYSHGGQTLLLVANLGAGAKRVRLSIDRGALGLPEGPVAMWVEAAGKSQALTGSEFELTVPERDFRTVRIEPAN